MGNINWEAVSAIGSCLGAIATFLAAIIALYPYFKKIKLYFTLNSNLDEGPVLTIVNGTSNIVMIESIRFFSGPIMFNKLFYEDPFIEGQDDLVSDKTNPVAEPYTYKKVTYNATRIIHDMTHVGYKYRVRRFDKLRIVLRTNLGKISINTHINTKCFLEHLIVDSSVYNHVKVEELINGENYDKI